jgi:hypothetical protein
MGWFREYSPGIVFRFCLMFALWLFYNIVPYVLPFQALFIVTGLMVAYALQLFKQKTQFMGYLMLLAALFNTLIALQINAALLFILVFVILLFDIVSTPMRGTA